MVEFNWRVDMVRAAILSSFVFYLNECRIINVLFLLSVTLLWIPSTILSPQYFFTDSRLCTFRLRDLFFYWWWWVIPSFLLSHNGIKTVFFKSMWMQCLHSTFFFKKILCCYRSRLLISNHVGKAECSCAIPGYGRCINTAQYYWLGWNVFITAGRSRVAASKKSLILFFFGIIKDA